MADDNQDSGDQRSSILWGLSFGAASAIALKTISALFPQRTTEDNTEKVTQVIIPAITINIPQNLSNQVKLQHNVSANPSVTINTPINLTDQVKLQHNASANQITSQSKPKAAGHPVSCEQLIGSLLNDCKGHDSNQCDSYSKIYKQFCSGSDAGAAVSTKDIGSRLLLDSFYGCMQWDYSSVSRKACREKYRKLMQIKSI